MKKLLLIPVALILLVPILFYAFSSHTVVKQDPAVTVVGSATPVRIHLENPHGIRHLLVSLEQNGTRYPIHEESQPATRLMFLRKHEAPKDVQVTAGKSKAPQIKDGKARLIIEAKGNDLAGHTDTLVRDVDINTQPPSLVVDNLQHYINQGGMELVTFHVGGYVTDSGVRVGRYTFRSFPMPGKEASDRFAYFAYPWDLAEDVVPIVYARNPSGAEATGRFWFKLFPKKFRSRDLDISDNFLQKVVPQIDQGGSGDLLPRFLKINGELRKSNNATLTNLRDQTEQKVLWNGPFLQLGNSKVEAQFADVRSYVYKGKKVDQQVHLGFDLSVTQNVGVIAANDGKVVFADNLGIYGNCIVVDHGYGLQSLYAHLSKIEVKPGDMVTKGQTIGRSGSTGLAGGDHLHYSMQLDGVQINPVEWWDAHWIKDRILSKLPGRTS